MLIAPAIDRTSDLLKRGAAMSRKRNGSFGKARPARECPPSWRREPSPVFVGDQVPLVGRGWAFCAHCEMFIGPCQECGEAVEGCPCCAGAVVLL